MNYAVGKLYLIRNWVTGEGPYFIVREVLQYKAHQIIYGDLTGHNTRIWRGAQEHKGRPTVFPSPNLVTGPGAGRNALAALMMCIEHTGGDAGTGRPFGQVRISALPAGADIQQRPYKQLLSGVVEEPVYAAGRDVANMWGGQPFLTDCQVCGGWGGPTCQGHNPNRDGQVRFAQKLLDLYADVLRLEHLPRWYINERAAYLNKQAAAMRGEPPKEQRKLY